MPVWTWMMMSFSPIFVQISVLEMPVFEPNEYFWKHHWDGKEEKWVAYARAVRQIMGETGGFPLVDMNVEDKLEYRNIVRGVVKDD